MKDSVKFLTTEKDDLLDFVEKNNETVKNLESSMKETSDRLLHTKSERDYFQLKFEETLKSN